MGQHVLGTRGCVPVLLAWTAVARAGWSPPVLVAPEPSAVHRLAHVRVVPGMDDPDATVLADARRPLVFCQLEAPVTNGLRMAKGAPAAVRLSW